MGWDDVQKKQPRYLPQDPLAKLWANDYNSLAFDPRYEKRAATYSKRRNGTYTGIDLTPGGFYGSPETKSVFGAILTRDEVIPILVVLGLLWFLS